MNGQKEGTEIRESAMTSDVDVPMPVMITAAQLPSLRPYTCVKHTSKEAFCLCTKCGDLLCEKCSLQIRGRRYCLDCASQDDQLREDCFEESVIPAICAVPPEAPKTVRELPGALLCMFRNSYLFFVTAKDSPFWLTLPLAFIASFPAVAVQYVFKLDNLPKIYDESQIEMIKHAGELFRSLETWQILCVAAFGTLLRILLFDLLFFACLHVFSRNEIRFVQAASTLHYCMAPMIIAVLGVALDQVWIVMVAEVLMIILATSATRAATKCSFWQGMGAMLLFILMSNFLF